MAQAPLARKLAFTASGFGNSACLATMGIYLMYFYTDVALLGVGLAGLVKGIGRVFDAVNDPVAGYFLFRNFSLTRERLSEIQSELSRRRASVTIAGKVG